MKERVSQVIDNLDQIHNLLLETSLCRKSLLMMITMLRVFLFAAVVNVPAVLLWFMYYIEVLISFCVLECSVLAACYLSRPG